LRLHPEGQAHHAEFMSSVNQVAPINTKYTNVILKDMRPTKADMTLLLGALLIQDIVPGPQLITQHPDIF
jgi:hypothetical protein